MKKIFIAGGGGYVGSRFCEMNPQYDITVMDHFWFGDHLPQAVKTIRGDIQTLKPEDLEGYDVVMFLAGLSNDPMASFRPDLNFIQNSAVSTYLAFITKQAGIKKFIGASSCSVYGYTKNKTLTEASELKPSYPYGISKLQFERGVMLLEDETFKPVLFRKGTVGGWSPRMRFDLVVNTMTMTALTTGKIIVNNPQLWRPLIDIRDVVRGYRLAIEADENITGIYNLSGQNYTIGDLAETIRVTLKERGYLIKVQENDIEDVRNYKVSTGLMEDVFGYYARYTPMDSVSEILQNTGLSFYFSKDEYYNIKVFEKVTL